MTTPVKQLDPGNLWPRKIVFSNQEYLVEVCRHLDSLKAAFKLRYEAYRQVGSISPNPSGKLWDDYDTAPHTWTHLVWHNDKPVATIRSCIYSSIYDWQTTEANETFRDDIAQALGKQVPFLESNRFAVSPDFQGRRSMFAQLLLFQMHALNSAVHEIDYIVTSVREHHAPFYQRFLGMEEISLQRRRIDWVNADCALMATRRDHCLQVALKKGMPNYSDADLERYKNYAGIAI